MINESYITYSSSSQGYLRVQNGIIVSEGRYVNQPVWVAHYVNQHPNDNLYDENGNELLAYEIMDHEKRTFPDLREQDWVILSEGDNGDLTVETMTSAEFEALEAKVAEDLAAPTGYRTDSGVSFKKCGCVILLWRLAAILLCRPWRRMVQQRLREFLADRAVIGEHRYQTVVVIDVGQQRPGGSCVQRSVKVNGITARRRELDVGNEGFAVGSLVDFEGASVVRKFQIEHIVMDEKA